MNKAVKILCILPIMFTSGCTTTQLSFFDRSVIEDKIGNAEKFGTLALTGERRLAVFSDTIVCAEAQPDVAVSRTAESNIKTQLSDIASASGEFENTESYKTALEVLYKRTEKSDLVRQIGWQLCQAFMNDAIDDTQYAQMLTAMMATALSAGEKDSVQSFTESTKAIQKLLK